MQSSLCRDVSEPETLIIRQHFGNNLFSNKDRWILPPIDPKMEHSIVKMPFPFHEKIFSSDTTWYFLRKGKSNCHLNLNISVKQNSTCQYLIKNYNISTTCHYKAEGISSTKQVVFFHLVRPCDNNCKNEEINSFQPHLKRKWVCFPAEKADMFSSPRQIVYTSSQ